MKTFLFTLGLTISTIAFGQTEASTAEYGDFSVSLTVEDITASYEFYQKLGFKRIEGFGGIDEKWLILQRDGITIGLFQGMFPKNVMTFNPLDVRSVHKTIEAAGLKPIMTNGLEKEEGPCYFILEDPDGNPIYFDQH
jgi:catechol 2,3-dioxygenase-like lactoylglutathione lyase family enzyme